MIDKAWLNPSPDSLLRLFSGGKAINIRISGMTSLGIMESSGFIFPIKQKNPSDRALRDLNIPKKRKT